MTDAEVVIDWAEVAKVPHEDWFRRSLAGTASQIVARSRRTAPRHTGAGADSIHAVTLTGPQGWEAHISWDEEHRYMRFQRSHAIQDAAHELVGN